MLFKSKDNGNGSKRCAYSVFMSQYSHSISLVIVKPTNQSTELKSRANELLQIRIPLECLFDLCCVCVCSVLFWVNFFFLNWVCKLQLYTQKFSLIFTSRINNYHHAFNTKQIIHIYFSEFVGIFSGF